MGCLVLSPDGPSAWTNSSSPDNGLDANNNPINGTPHNSKIDLSLSMTVDNPTPSVGSNITFTLTVTNHGIYNATNVSIKNDFLTNKLNLYFRYWPWNILNGTENLDNRQIWPGMPLM
ncbi:MAG: hypothetical protein IPL71_12295 [Anaerolineales bacterium]|nr:hypothetical protein [Anaerolineales bacterium]